MLPMLQMWTPHRRQHGNQGSTLFSKGLRSAKADLTTRVTGQHQDREVRILCGVVEQDGRGVGFRTTVLGSKPMDHMAVSLGKLAFLSLPLFFHLKRGC